MLYLGSAFILLYPVAAWLLDGYPFAQSIFGNTALVLSAATVPVIVLARRRRWAGCERLFWDIIAVSLVLWIVGHLGWAYDQLLHNRQNWITWHTLFSLCAGIGPPIALLARPHLGPRTAMAAPVATTVIAYCLLGVFIYSYFVILPSLVPSAHEAAERRLLNFVQANRVVLLVAMGAAFWAARRTAWRLTYLRIAVGVGIGVLIREAANLAIVRGDYHAGSVYDLAWIIPWLFYAWAAAGAPPSAQVSVYEEAHEISSVSLLAVPALLIPLLGYGVLNVEAVGEPVDSFRLFLTSLATVAALGLVTLRLAAQGSELRRADARLQLLAAAMEHTGDLILIARPNGRFEHANTAFLRAFGYSKAELMTMEFVDLIEPGMDHMRHDIPEEVRRKGVWRGTLRGRRKDGTTFPAACTITGLRDSWGRITHFVGVERDITDDLHLRDQLVHSERLSAMGELIAGVAHEINNPLQTIIGTTELMLDEPSGANRDDLEVVRREAMRAGQIVRNLLAFARRGAPDRVVADLNDLVRATAALREYHLTQVNIQLRVRCDAQALPVLVNREEILQVILNLLLNAEQAIANADPNGGSITMETSRAGAFQIVEVNDSGPGISPELRGRIFEPFFTTKEVGQGTGLGLSISLGIVASHGGSLTLVDAAKGARFRLSLPAPAEAVAPTASTTGERARALVVSEEEALRKLLVKLLEKRGFAVSEAASSAVALPMAEASRPALIVCDAAGREVAGAELYERLTVNGSNGTPPRFLFIGGATTAAAVAGSDVPVLIKPFTATDLDQALARTGIVPRTPPVV